MPTPDRTSLPAIIDAARELLESGGPPAVTMQAVADRVGVRAPSLYKRVRDRETLLTLVAEATATSLAARLKASDGSLSALARAYRSFAHERPEGFRLLFASPGSPETMSATVEPILAAARAVVGDEDALAAARLLTAWATGFISMELAGVFRMGGDIDDAFEYGLAHLQAGLSR